MFVERRGGTLPPTRPYKIHWCRPPLGFRRSSSDARWTKFIRLWRSHILVARSTSRRSNKYRSRFRASFCALMNTPGPRGFDEMLPKHQDTARCRPVEKTESSAINVARPVWSSTIGTGSASVGATVPLARQLPVAPTPRAIPRARHERSLGPTSLPTLARSRAHQGPVPRRRLRLLPRRRQCPPCRLPRRRSADRRSPDQRKTPRRWVRGHVLRA